MLKYLGGNKSRILLQGIEVRATLTRKRLMMERSWRGRKAEREVQESSCINKIYAYIYIDIPIYRRTQMDVSPA